MKARSSSGRQHPRLMRQLASPVPDPAKGNRRSAGSAFKVLVDVGVAVGASASAWSQRDRSSGWSSGPRLSMAGASLVVALARLCHRGLALAGFITDQTTAVRSYEELSW